MSDGPHRSLPMQRHWRNLAERAAKSAFSPDQVCEALPTVLKADFRGVPLDVVRDILGGGKHSTLFPDDKVVQLESVRRICPGSAAGGALINCAIDAVTKGLTGDGAFLSALENAFDDHARAGFRSVEEHYQREGSQRGARFARQRLDEARRQCNLKSLAQEFVAADKRPSNTIRLPQHTGIDEGPQL